MPIFPNVKTSSVDAHTAPHRENPPDDSSPSGDDAADMMRDRLRKLPPEVGVVLMGAGLLGVILPGPVGTPLVLAGGLVLVPGAFQNAERWIARKFPAMHRAGMKYVDRFLDDFERRYPPQSR
jgi:hypothetical protein